MQNDKGAVELLFGKKSTEHKHKHQNKKKVIKKKEPSSDQKQQSSKDKLLEKYAKEKITENLEHLRFQLNGMNTKRVEVQCFGKFDIFVDGIAVKFGRAKAKELLAYLVDRNGTMCNNEDLLSILWQDKKPTKSLKQQLRNLIYDLNKSLNKVDAQNIIIRKNNIIGIDKEKIKCDYYDFQKGDPKALQSFNGEYMTQYSDWSYTMELNLQKYFYEE